MTTLKNNLFCREQRGAALKIENKAEVIVRLRREPGVGGVMGVGGQKDSGRGVGGHVMCLGVQLSEYLCF